VLGNMPRMPLLSAKRLYAILIKLGFFVDRQRGSHVTLMHADGRRTTIAMHTGDMPKGTLNTILDEVKLTPDELRKLI